jgi:hypothetical protein
MMIRKMEEKEVSLETFFFEVLQIMEENEMY